MGDPVAELRETELRQIVGHANVLTAADEVASYVTDWTGRFRGSTPAVVRPGSTDEVAAIIHLCRRTGTHLVPQGGNTGLVGGATPLGHEVVLSLQRLNAVERVDSAGGQLVAGAGTTISAVDDAARSAGWRYGVDLGARGSATVGGTIATNAGGLRVLRYGATRHQVLGVEAVTGTGAIVGDLRGLVKDNTGYHLPSLLCGSEGTLAVVTKACLALVPAPAEEAVALLGVASLEAAVLLATELRRGLAELSALELFLDAGLELVLSELGLARPLGGRHGAYLLVEVAGGTGVADRLVTSLSGAGAVDDAAIATDRAGQARLWHYREAHTEAIGRIGVPHKLDVTVALAAIATFAAEVTAMVSSRWPAAQIWLFGHAGDGNLHVNVTGVDPDDHSLDATVFELVAALGGSISAEHGIGRAKRPWLQLNRTADELALYRDLKAAFDPSGILNPGALLG